MTVAINAVTTGTTDSTTLTVQHTAAGSDRAAVVFTHVRDDDNLGVTIDTVTYDGTGMTKVIERDDGGGGNRVITAMWELAAPSTTTNANVVVTLSGNAHMGMGVISLTGVNQTTPTANHQSGINASPSITVTSATDDLVLDGITSRTSSPIPTPDPSQNEEYSVGTSKQRDGASSKAGATSVTMSWTNTDAQCALVGGTVQQVAAPVVRNRFHIIG